MPTEPKPVTLFEIVRKAVDVCWPAGGDSPGLDELLEAFEDAEEPASGVGDIESRLDQVLGEVDPDAEPEVAMARAVIVYLAFRRDELHAAPEELLQLAARAEFGDSLPSGVELWLSQQGA
jgi:hypothetical protein